MDHRRERIRIETERHRIVGELTLARDGYRSRVSDVLNAPERDFLTLTEVTVEPLAGGPVELYPYLTLARRHIVFAVAASDGDDPGPAPHRMHDRGIRGLNSTHTHDTGGR